MDDPYAWQDRALCRGLSHLFDPPEPTDEVERWAKDVCLECPVLHDCTVWVFSLTTAHDPECVTAGMTFRERRSERQRRALRAYRARQAVS